MVVWCNKCGRYINQVCERCGDSFGEMFCEKYACGGKMICPICRVSDLESVSDHKKKEEDTVDKYDYATLRKMGRSAEAAPQSGGQQAQGPRCMSCGFDLDPKWNFCPNCGISLRIKK